MIKSLLIAAAVLSAGSAFASKSRVNALGSAAHLVDFQNGFEKPQDFNEFGELITFEWGTAAYTAGSSHGEGGFLRHHGDAVYGFYLGRHSDDFATSVTNANGATASASWLGERNPWNLLYARKMGDMKIGFNFHYSKSEVKTTTVAATAGPAKSDVMGFSIGAKQDAWDAALVMGLSGNSSVDVTGGTYKMKQKSNMKLHGGYYMDTVYLNASYKTASGTVDNTTATTLDADQTTMSIGAIDTLKKDGANFFYGISYDNQVTKNNLTSTKTDNTSLPLIVGIEAEAASWLTLRGSAKQDTGLLGGNKTDAGTDSNADATTVAAGVGLKFNKFTMDGTLASTGGKLFDGLGTNGVTANTSLTYNF
jgi:hypothetical protein